MQPEDSSNFSSEDSSFSPVGMSLETATILLNAAGYSTRVVRQGKIHTFITADVKSHRVNLELNEEGYVESFHLG